MTDVVARGERNVRRVKKTNEEGSSLALEIGNYELGPGGGPALFRLAD